LRPASMSCVAVHGYGGREVRIRLRRTPPAMTPIAAYYVMVATDHEREMRPRHHETIAPRPSLASRVVAALETLIRLGRPASTQPI
jgi:hypothetical protein